MPLYTFHCPLNGQTHELLLSVGQQVPTWGELCRLSGQEPGDTPEETPVTKLMCPPALQFPKTNTELKNLGFTKLERRDRGVYENVTATKDEQRYVRADDPTSLPHLSGKITD